MIIIINFIIIIFVAVIVITEIPDCSIFFSVQLGYSIFAKYLNFLIFLIFQIYLFFVSVTSSLFDLIFFLHSFLYLNVMISFSLLFLFIYSFAPSLCRLTSCLNGHCSEGTTTLYYTTLHYTYYSTQHNRVQYVMK